METKLTALKLPLELHKKIKEIALREGRDMQQIFREQLERYVKEHDKGNPAYKITQWVDNSDMKAYPAFKTIRTEWQKYIENLHDEKELMDILYQSQSISSFAEKKIKYGTTNVLIK